MLNKRFILAVILILVSASIGSEPIARFSALSTEDGLPSKSVRVIAQDGQGYVWFGTVDGLARYDGYGIHNFTSQSDLSGSLSGNNIRALHAGTDGALWIGTYSNGLSRFDHASEKFRTFRHDPDNPSSLSSDRIYAITSDNRGGVWLGTANGLDRVDSSSYQVTHFKLQNAQQAELPINRVLALLQTSSDQLWVAATNGLSIYDHTSGKFETVELNTDLKVYALHESNDGLVWIGANSGLFLYDPAVGKVVEYTDVNSETFFDGKSIYAINSDFKGNVWLGGGNTGLCRIYSSKTPTCYRYDKGIAHSIRDNTILSLIRDTSEQLWIGSYKRGVQKLDLNSLDFGLGNTDRNGNMSCQVHQEVNAILVENKALHWLGTEVGLSKFDATSGDCQYFDTPAHKPKTRPVKQVYSVFRDSRDILWAGSARGLNRLNESGSALERINEMPAALTSFINEDKYGNLFVASGNKIYKYKPGTDSFSPLKVADEKLNGYVWSFLFDNEDNMWIGTSKGLAIRASGTDHYDYVQVNGKPVITNVVGAMYLHDNGDVWVGVDDIGIIVLDRTGTEKTRYTKKDGLENLKFSYIAKDRSNNLWISTRLGIVKLNPATREIKSFREKDGLQSNFFMQNSGFQTKSGKLYLGGNKGFNAFNPKNIKANRSSPSVVLNKLYRFNKTVVPEENYDGFILPAPLSQVENLILTHREYVFSIEFIGLHFADPSRNNYAFKMEGVDPDWNFTDATNRRATYTNLDPGKYIFKVKSSNKDGIWNDKITSLDVTVLPPWWLTWWAYTLYTMLTISTVYSWYKWRTASLTRRTKELERIVGERTVELKNRNQDVKKLLTTKDTLLINISHEFKTPLTVLYGAFEFLQNIALKGNEVLKVAKLTGQVQYMMRLVDQLLQLSRLESVTELKREPVNLTDYLNQLIPMYDSTAKTLNVEMRVSIEDGLIVMAERESFEHVFTNLISNAIKYNKRNGFVEIFAVKKENHCVVIIRDSGIGIAPENHERVFKRFGKLDTQEVLDHQVMSSGLGLAIVKEAVEANQGKLELVSELGEGSTFNVSFPLSKTSHDIVSEFDNFPAKENIRLLESYAEVAAKIEVFVPEIQEHKNTLLIIEDVSDVSDYIVETLSEDYNTLVANNGEKGVKLATEYLPDLILSDIMMPGMDGFEVLKTLKSQEVTAHIPIILLTAMGDVNARIKGFELHADDYLGKPFSPDELRLRIKTKLEYRDILRSRFEITEVVSEQSKSVASESDTSETKAVSTFDVAAIENETKKNFILKVNQWIDEHIDETITTSELASHLAMSSKQLGRKLKQITPFNSVEYIRSYRLVKAYNRLPEEENITNLAFDLGFSSPSYFTNTFKAYFGIRPKERQQGIEAKKGTLME